MHQRVGRGRRRAAVHHRFAVACLLGLLLVAGAQPGAPAQTVLEKTPAPKTAPAETETEVARYASLKSDRVVLFKGPGREHPVAGEFRRAGLPIEVLDEHEGWRRVRDAGGVTGWMHGSLLSSRRTALILPWELKEGRAQGAVVTLRNDDHDRARAVAQVDAGVLVGIISCARQWCRVSTGDHRGYIEQGSLWGTYLGEEIK